jgi:hypothetical protein
MIKKYRDHSAVDPNSITGLNEKALEVYHQGKCPAPGAGISSNTGTSTAIGTKGASNFHHMKILIME